MAQAQDVSTKKVECVRKRWVEEGLEAARARTPVPTVHRRTITGADEAHWRALCWSPAPEGHATGTLRMLAETMVALDMVDSVSHETIRQT